MVSIRLGSLFPSPRGNSTRFQSKTKLGVSASQSGRLREYNSCLCQVTIPNEPLQLLKWRYVKRLLEVFTRQVRKPVATRLLIPSDSHWTDFRENLTFLQKFHIFQIEPDVTSTPRDDLCTGTHDCLVSLPTISQRWSVVVPLPRYGEIL